MATKKFKKLPKDAQRAAFAEMDKDGTRQNRGGKSGGGVAAKTLKPSAKRLPHLKTPESKALFDKSVARFDKATPLEKSKMRQALTDNEIHAESSLRTKEKDFAALSSKQRGKNTLAAARAFRLSRPKNK